jgi:hypothetical protein
VLILAAAFLAAPAPAPPSVWRSEPVPARAARPGHGVRVTGAWTFARRLPRFGGISGVAVEEDHLLLLSDAGLLWRAPKPDVPGPIRPVALPAACRPGSAEAEGADTEALALAPDGRALRIGIEGANAICAPDLDAAVAIPAMAAWPRNQGIEALATMPGRGMLAIGGMPLDRDGARPLVWFAGDPARAGTPATLMRYLPPPGFQPSDAAFLPDGRLLVLNRRYRVLGGYGSAIVLTKPFVPSGNATVAGDVIARFAGAALGANFEGLAVETTANGIALWLVSDNNFFPGRRTRLLRLALDAPGGP